MGLSALANLVREEYIRIATATKVKPILSNEPVRTYSSTLTPKYDLPVDNRIVKNNQENLELFKSNFYPMGKHSKNDEHLTEER